MSHRYTEIVRKEVHPNAGPRSHKMFAMLRRIVRSLFVSKKFEEERIYFEDVIAGHAAKKVDGMVSGKAV